METTNFCLDICIFFPPPLTQCLFIIFFFLSWNKGRKDAEANTASGRGEIRHSQLSLPRLQLLPRYHLWLSQPTFLWLQQLVSVTQGKLSPNNNTGDITNISKATPPGTKTSSVFVYNLLWDLRRTHAAREHHPLEFPHIDTLQSPALSKLLLLQCCFGRICRLSGSP